VSELYKVKINLLAYFLPSKIQVVKNYGLDLPLTFEANEI